MLVEISLNPPTHVLGYQSLRALRVDWWPMFEWVSEGVILDPTTRERLGRVYHRVGLEDDNEMCIIERHPGVDRFIRDSAVDHTMELELGEEENPVESCMRWWRAEFHGLNDKPCEDP